MVFSHVRSGNHMLKYSVRSGCPTLSLGSPDQFLIEDGGGVTALNVDRTDRDRHASADGDPLDRLVRLLAQHAGLVD
jgi:hypothetical protein